MQPKAQGGDLTPSEYCNQTRYTHPQAACQQKSSIVDQVGSCREISFFFWIRFIVLEGQSLSYTYTANRDRVRSKLAQSTNQT